MKISLHYCCHEANCDYAPLFEFDDKLSCKNGHIFHCIPETKIPVFAYQANNTSEYMTENAVNIHDNAYRWVFDTFGSNESMLRENLISRLHLSAGQKILVTGAGAGNDLPFLANCMQSGTIYAQDISKEMLLAGVDRYAHLHNYIGVEMYFSVSDAMQLPFASNTFDGAYHFGGINLYNDLRRGIHEMDRVVKPGGRVVFGDEGVAPWLKSTELGKMLIKNNPLYDYNAPLALLPDTANSVNLSWVLNHCFYVIDYTVSNEKPNINIDVPHIGKRGGSVRSRYMGQIEGINPELRDKIYAAAEKQGMSRVDYIEHLLRRYIEHIEDGCEPS